MTNEKFRTTLVVEDYTQESDRENKMAAWKKIGFGVAPHEQEDQFYVFGIMNQQTLGNALVRLKGIIKEAIVAGNLDQVLHPADLVEIMFKFDSRYETNFTQTFQEDCTLLGDYYQNQGEEPVMSFENAANTTEAPAEEDKVINNTPETIPTEGESSVPVEEEKKEETPINEETPAPEVKEETPITEEKKEEAPTSQETTPPAEEKKEEAPANQEAPENKEPERNITVEVVSSGDIKLEDIIEIGPKGVSNKQMIPALKTAVEEKSKGKLALLKTTYPDIYESSIKYIGHKRQQELKTLEEEMAKAQ